MFTQAHRGNMLCQKFSGSVDSKGILKAQERFHAHPGFKSLRFLIADFLDCEEFVTDADLAMYLAAFNVGAYQTNSFIDILVITDNADVIDLGEECNKSGLFPYPLHHFVSYAELSEWIVNQKYYVPKYYREIVVDNAIDTQKNE